jgi:hypothetical protein
MTLWEVHADHSSYHPGVKAEWHSQIRAEAFEIGAVLIAGEAQAEPRLIWSRSNVELKRGESFNGAYSEPK